MYKFGTTEEIDQSIWKPASPLFWIWLFAPLFGAMLIAIGKSLQVESKRPGGAIILTVFLILFNVFPETIGYRVWACRATGGLISVLFIVLV